MSNTTHLDYMSQALRLAELGRLTVSPNPMVGCVIVKNDRIIGQGYHQRAGTPHAEIHALHDAGENAKEASVYVTLEPCCHTGRTPPCTQALINAGIKKVYVACLDPNPLMAGKGIQALQAAGIEVEVGLLEQEAKQLNKIFFHYIVNKRPFVIAKWAMSLDGKTVTHDNDERAISNAASQQSSHKLRQQADAILVGAKTATHDNPLLTARSPDSVAMKQPVRVILSSKGGLPLTLKLFDASMPAKTIVATTSDSGEMWRQSLSDNNIETLILPKNKHGRIDLSSLLDELGKREITSLLVEGGMTVHEDFMQEDLINQFQVYLAPVIIGSLEKKKYLSNMQMKDMAGDYYFISDAGDENHV